MQQVPLAVFTCRTNSHPFQERHISVHEPVKIGRSVARVKPAQNNAIFDCRVLSRNHALMWYENNKFYLQDTKSSNGTFVNNQRLSKASEESSPQEISSGDTIQFGVDVMENSRTRVTHSCIIATVQLFHPDGTEARRDFSPFSQLPGGVAVQSQELYQLSQFLQEALHREQMLENKLATLQRLVDTTQDASESGWQALIDEDRLLSKLEVLQNQLQVYSKNQTEDSLRQELTALQEDKYNYENTAKESLRKVLEEKLEAVRKLSDLERSLGNKEDECQHLRQLCESSQKNLEELAEKHQEQLQELANLHEKIQEADKAHKAEMEALNNEKEELWSKLQDMVKQESILQAKVESLQADNDFTKEQLANMRAKMDSIKETSHDSLRIPELMSQGIQVEMVNLLDLQRLHSGASSSDSDSEKDDNDVEMKDSGAKEVADALADLDFELDSQDVDEDEDSMNEKELRDCLDELCELSSHPPDSMADSDADQSATPSTFDQSGASDFTDTLKPEKLRDTQESIEHFKKLLRESEIKQNESMAKIKQLQNELKTVKAESCGYVEKIHSLEESLSASESQLSSMVEQAQQDLRVQLEESEKQKQSHVTLTSDLHQEIKRLEVELAQQGVPESSAEGTLQRTSSAETRGSQDVSLKLELAKVTDKVGDLEASLEHKQCESTLLKELLHESRTELTSKKEYITTLEGRIEAANARLLQKEMEAVSLQAQVSKVTDEVRMKSGHVDELQDQLNRAELTTKEVKEQILALRDRIVEEQDHTKSLTDESSALQQRLEESQRTSLQARKETEELKVKVKELEYEISRRKDVSGGAQAGSNRESSPKTAKVTETSEDLPERPDTNLPESPIVSEPLLDAVDSSTPKSDGFAALRDECASLKRRIQILENDMKTYSQENKALKRSNSVLHESYEEVKAIKDSLEVQENAWKLNLTDAQKSTDKTKTELMEARDYIAQLNDKIAEYKEEISVKDASLAEEKQRHTDDLRDISYRSKMVSAISALPLIALIFALVMAFEPFLSSITATSPR